MHARRFTDLSPHFAKIMANKILGDVTARMAAIDFTMEPTLRSEAIVPYCGAMCIHVKYRCVCGRFHRAHRKKSLTHSLKHALFTLFTRPLPLTHSSMPSLLSSLVFFHSLPFLALFHCLHCLCLLTSALFTVFSCSLPLSSTLFTNSPPLTPLSSLPELAFFCSSIASSSLAPFYFLLLFTHYPILFHSKSKRSSTLFHSLRSLSAPGTCASSRGGTRGAWQAPSGRQAWVFTNSSMVQPSLSFTFSLTMAQHGTLPLQLLVIRNRNCRCSTHTHARAHTHTHTRIHTHTHTHTHTHSTCAGTSMDAHDCSPSSSPLLPPLTLSVPPPHPIPQIRRL
jgi:hypothetical protein